MIIGHSRVLDFLKKSIEKKRIAHAYIFTGPAHLGKRTVALEFIRMLNGQEISGIHPDVLITEPEIIEKQGVQKESRISINQARKIQHQMSLSPYSADYKIALIDQAEKMNPEAGNCLLKTLEEPSGQAVLILITANPQMLLPTIVSRCQIVNFLPVPSKEIKKALPKAKEQIIRLANGRPGIAINYLENPELLQEQDKIIGQLEKLLRADLNERYKYAEDMAKNAPEARQILNQWLFWFRDLLLLSHDCSGLTIHPKASQYQGSYSSSKLKSIIQTIKKTNWLLANPSNNARLVLEVLMLEI